MPPNSVRKLEWLSPSSINIIIISQFSMDRFEQPSAKLLYLISEMERQRMITTVEKATLKSYVLSEHEAIYELLKKFPTSEHELNLAIQLIVLLRGEYIDEEQEKLPIVKDEDYQNDGQQIPVEAESPLGNQLMMKKLKKKPQQPQKGADSLLKLNQAQQ